MGSPRMRKRAPKARRAELPPQPPAVPKRKHRAKARAQLSPAEKAELCKWVATRRTGLSGQARMLLHHPGPERDAAQELLRRFDEDLGGATTIDGLEGLRRDWGGEPSPRLESVPLKGRVEDLDREWFASLSADTPMRTRNASIRRIYRLALEVFAAADPSARLDAALSADWAAAVHELRTEISADEATRILTSDDVMTLRDRNGELKRSRTAKEAAVCATARVFGRGTRRIMGIVGST